MKMKTVLNIAVFFVFLAVIFPILNQSTRKFIRTNIVRYDVAPSTSMEPTDYVFKGGQKRREVKDIIYGKWHIRLPRAFVYSEIGHADAVAVIGNGEYYSIAVSAAMDIDTGDFSPHILVDRSEYDKKKKISLTLANKVMGQSSRVLPVCRTIRKEYSEGLSGKLRSPSICGLTQNPRCRASGHWKGWSIRGALPPKVFTPENPKFDLYCEAIDRFLDDITVNITEFTK